MSESDLYRKQRVAMAALAQVIARMEADQWQPAEGGTD
jgi:hypothetical protein